MSKETIRLFVNKKEHVVDIDPAMPLLYVLRNHLGLYGPKYGCGLGQCGCCMILLDDQIALSCQLSVKSVEGKKITSLAGLAPEDDRLHPVQQAFIDEQAAQCGYCTNGMILSTVSLLNQIPAPTEVEIRQALGINLCRCGTQSRVIRAVKNASNMINTSK